MKKYQPEGSLIKTEENRNFISSVSALQRAYDDGRILEARAILCDCEHNLHVDFGAMRGIMYRTDTALGIDDGSVRDIAIISRVNKPICFKIIGFKEDENGQPLAVLSRKEVQVECLANYIAELRKGDIISAKVSHIESFGVFADIGAGISALLPIDSISVSRIPHPNVHFRIGQSIKAVVKDIDENGRVTLSHKELLGTWEQNAQLFNIGETVPGIVRSIEKYGVFIELMPNLAGLAEFSPDVKPGQLASVYIKSIIPERMKVKLIVVDAFDSEQTSSSIKYFTDSNHIDRWVYSPEAYPKIIETVF